MNSILNFILLKTIGSIKIIHINKDTIGPFEPEMTIVEILGTKINKKRNDPIFLYRYKINAKDVVVTPSIPSGIGLTVPKDKYLSTDAPFLIKSPKIIISVNTDIVSKYLNRFFKSFLSCMNTLEKKIKDNPKNTNLAILNNPLKGVGVNNTPNIIKNTQM